MNENLTEQNRVKCPFCAEFIMPDAKLCRFCKSKLDGGHTDSKSPQSIGVFKAIILNLVCPGLTAWRLGHRLRGAIILLLVTISLALYAIQITPVIDRAVQQAVRTGNTRRLNGLTSELEKNPWFDRAMYIYLYSFIDIFFLLGPNKKKDDGKPDEKA
ncbi:MAG: hypothetical protein PWR01_3361 [Clostridiales bacterium]|nr:hypothetical protein [Clostridiales bacterium]MDN5282288.1 hypothetical protein [Candidatus Ozemobacter sp.]